MRRTLTLYLMILIAAAVAPALVIAEHDCEEVGGWGCVTTWNDGCCEEATLFIGWECDEGYTCEFFNGTNWEQCGSLYCMFVP